ncbi:hypothetical protein LLE49_20030 [Alicyclobacillus tolerans]|uniref:hypothetical protein n=1 Tax=Alicyclobacillus tolerans TaxID=90970 RepID=UPI001F2F193E|nr:hypothetical protein [Alicyclobacillus tolerans]MCF8567013.1 hypothetical protein [Alicyclobacillus tolerans]
MTAINPRVYQLAQMVSQATGLHTQVVLAQWDAEQGGTGMLRGQWNNFYNNPAGMTYGVPQVDALSNGTQNGFLTFPSRQAGAQAYADFYLYAPSMANVRKAFNGSAQSQLNAIAASPWAGSHYSANGVPGQALFNDYNSLTGAKLVPNTASYLASQMDTAPTQVPGTTFSDFLTNLNSDMTIDSGFSILHPVQGGKALALRGGIMLLGIILIIFGLLAIVNHEVNALGGIRLGV